VEFDASDSLFEQAHMLGWNPAIAGWYNPYCRLLPRILTACFWTPGIQTFTPFEDAGASEGNSAFANALALPLSSITELFEGDRTGDELRRLNVEDYRSILHQASGLIRDGDLHFIFLHLPIPHPPGAYDRRRHQLCPCGNYLDNLSLADDTLGELRKEIDGTPWASETTIIVSSDHSWRVPLWRRDSDWTAEEERVSKGQFDPRPVFLIHFAAQRTGVDIDAQVPELREHDVIASMLSGKIGDAEGLNNFVQLSSH
jgi:hypothetical protein